MTTLTHLSLVQPAPALEASYRSYIAELGDEERYPFPLDFDASDFPALLQRLENLARGIGNVHIHCHKHNAASARMIIANGGVLHSEVAIGEPAEVVQRFIVPAH